jgi:hypothetical protein
MPKVNLNVTKVKPFKSTENRVLFITENTKEAFYKDVTKDGYQGSLKNYRNQIFELFDLWGVPVDVITVTSNSSTYVNEIYIKVDKTTLIKESQPLYIYNDIDFITVALEVGDNQGAVITKIKNALLESEYFTDIYYISTTSDSVKLRAKENSSYLNNVGMSFSSVAGLVIDYTSTSKSSTKAISRRRLDELTARYRAVLTNYESVGVVSDWLEDRWNVKNDIRDGVAFTLLNKEPSSLLGRFVAPFYNDIDGNKARQDYSIYSLVKFIAIRSYRLTTNRPLGNSELYEMPNRELRGGCHMATVPYFNTPLYNHIKECLTDNELLNIEDNLLATMLPDINPNIKSVTSQVFVSDDNYMTLNNIDALSCVREIIFDKLKRYKQMRLSDRVRRPQTVTKMTVKAGVIEALTLSSELAIVRREFIDMIETEFRVDYENGVVDFSIKNIPLVSQLRAINGDLQFIL